MKRIKIIHVLNSVGGVDVSLRQILENIDPDRFENIVVHGLNDTKKEFLDRRGNKLKNYRLPIIREIHLRKDLCAISGVIGIFKKERPDIVHAHSAKGGILARTGSIFYKVKVMHTPQAYSFLSVPSGLKRRIYVAIERGFRRINSVLIASSESERIRGIKEVGYPEDKALLFNNAISPILPDEVARPLIDLPNEYICTVGRPSFQKNIEMMVRVLAKLKMKIPNIHLVLMGVGEYSPNIEEINQMVENLGLERNITMVGWMERKNIFHVISKARLYISTARYEGLPYSIIEAMSLGKAFVVTNVDGNRDLVLNGYNGYVIEENDEDAMSTKIRELYGDSNLLHEFGRKSNELFEEKYNIKKRIGELERIYDVSMSCPKKN